MLYPAIGLVHGWKSWTWISLMPPVPLIFLFKIWIVRSCEAQFRFYIPSPQEIAQTKVHSDSGAEGKLEKRFGHPALHADLFTPMVHAKMLHLLPQVYTGKLSNQKTALDEYGGQKLNAAVTSDGVRIAAVEQVPTFFFLSSLPFSVY
jgi:cytochrome b